MPSRFTPLTDWLPFRLPDVYVPPDLYRVPEAGWLVWASHLSDVAQAGPGTHSGNQIEADAPAWAQWLAVRAALAGLQSPEAVASSGIVVAGKELVAAQVIDWGRQEDARAVRAAFEAGRPLPVGQGTFERFTSFVPVLRYEAGRYVFGDGQSRQVVQADAHVAAMGKAAAMCDALRERESEARRRLADDKARSLPPVYLDLVQLQLEHDGLLLNTSGGLVAKLNGAHGNYFVVSERWCHNLRVSAGPAARLAVGSVLEDTPALGDGGRMLLRVDLMAQFAGLEGWQSDGAGGYEWEGGKVQAASGKWRLIYTLPQQGEKAAALVNVSQDLSQVTVVGAHNVVLAASPVPDRLRAEGSAPLLAWATWKARRMAAR